MTQRDKWLKRPAVVKYREFCDFARAQAGIVPPEPLGIRVVAYLPMPESWSAAKKKAKTGTYHRQKPDADNIVKAVMDALLQDDSCLAVVMVSKFWEDDAGPRVEVVWILGQETVEHVRD